MSEMLGLVLEVAVTVVMSLMPLVVPAGMVTVTATVPVSPESSATLSGPTSTVHPSLDAMVRVKVSALAPVLVMVC